MKTFLQPLSKEAEEMNLHKLTYGTDEESKEAKQILIERNLRLVAHIAKKYQNTDVDMEDLISIGTIGLIKAILTFDPLKNSKLATYAARCIDNELLMMLRSKKKSSREISLYEPIGTDREGNEISLLDVIEQEQPDIVEQMETNKRIGMLKDMMEKGLTKREQTILTMRYGLLNGQEITQREIGLQLGISRSYISRIEKKALKKLRILYEKETFNGQKETVP